MLSGGSPKFRGKCEQSGGGCRENRPCSPGQTKRLREEGLTGEELVERRKYRMNHERGDGPADLRNTACPAQFS